MEVGRGLRSRRQIADDQRLIAAADGREAAQRKGGV